jgi:carbon monoxide dehydrogenase subunit G
MASIRREVHIDVSPEAAWDALRDIGALHTRLVPGFVTDVKLEEGARIVTFGNGLVARELIVDIDDDARRIAWSVVGGRMTHHNASAQVFPEVRRMPIRVDRGPAAQRGRAGNHRDDRAGNRGHQADAGAQRCSFRRQAEG